jgi:hypothetical protein
MIMLKKRLFFLACWLFSSIILLVIAFFISQLFFKSEITKQLHTQLAPKLAEAFQQHMFDKHYKVLVKRNINQQLAFIKDASYLSVIKEYSLTVEALFSAKNQNNLHTVYIPWCFGLKEANAKLSIDYYFNWWLLIILSCSVSFFALLALFSLPKPTSSIYKNWLFIICKLNITEDVAKHLSQKLEQNTEAQNLWLMTLLESFTDTSELPKHIQIDALIIWFIETQPQSLNKVSQTTFKAAIMQTNITFDQAYKLVKEPSTLLFNIKSFSITVNGFEIKLAKTPFFYYLWYASLRVNNVQSGWLINPSINTPDIQSAKSLLLLMKEYKGHSKSINELENHGLRAKTLDQNRNKIKDTLIDQLGEELSLPYLFDLLRDTRTGRFQYRLKLDPDFIQLPKEIKHKYQEKNKL